MYAAVLVLAILIILLLCIKLSFLKIVPCAIVTLVFALFTGLSWPIAIEQSNLGIAAKMDNPALMPDTAVILTVEVFLQIAYCLLAARLMPGDHKRANNEQNRLLQKTGPTCSGKGLMHSENESTCSGKEKKALIVLFRILRLFPGLLAFPVLLFALLRLIYAFPGVPFARVAWMTAAGVAVLLPMLAYGIRALIPEKDIRLELLFLASVLELVLGIVTTVNGTTSFKGSDPVSWGALATFAALALVCALAGLLFNKIKTKKQYGTDF